jgi:Family of unknown function (DUF5662)
MLATKEMKDYFLMRTRAHLFLVHKYHNKIARLNYDLVDNDLLNKERDEHDQFKFSEPEYSPYLFITWSYYCQRKNIPFELTEEIKDKMHEATFHHIKNHRHHPEYWDTKCDMTCLNKDNRDKPSDDKIVNGTQMPCTYLAAMVADWCAMSEEMGTNSPKDWADANINIRWKFDSYQVNFIYELISEVWK